jgi:hypothetical protein
MSQLDTQKKTRIGVIANKPNEIKERAQMFFHQAFKPFENIITWEYITYKDLLEESKFNRAKSKQLKIETIY